MFAPPAENLAAAPRVLSPADGVQLTLVNPRRLGFRTVFDIEYARTESSDTAPSTVLSLGDLAAGQTVFADANSFYYHYGSHGHNVIGIDTRRLDRGSDGLLALGHEIGHTHQWPLVHSALTQANGRPPTTPELGDQLTAYGSLVQNLARCIRSNRDLRASLTRALDEWQPQSGPWDTNLPRLLDHMGVNTSVSALKEASAWHKALRLIADGSLQSTMSPQEMYEMAERNISTYDPQRGYRQPHLSALRQVLKNDPVGLQV